MGDPDIEMRLTTIAKPGIPSFLAKLIQIAKMIEGDYEFINNKSYLELDVNLMWKILPLPYAMPFYSIFYIPFFSVWATDSIIWYLLVYAGIFDEEKIMGTKNPREAFNKTYKQSKGPAPQALLQACTTGHLFQNDFPLLKFTCN